MWAEAQMLARFAAGLKPFLAETLTPEQARLMLAEAKANRTQAFLEILRRSVFGFPDKPYAWLFSRAGIGAAEAGHMVREHGIEGALQRWMDQGVYLTLDEFKGRVPIRRFGAELPVQASDFDNPLLKRDFEAATSGSSGVRRRLAIDLDLLRFETALHLLFFRTAVPEGSPIALWRPVPPGTAGIKRALCHLRAGQRLDRWFTMEPFSPFRPATKAWAITMTALASSRLAGKPVPIPQTVMLDEAARVARWAASQIERGATPYLDTTASAGVRVVRAALDGRLNLRGAFFRTGSEPLTPARAALFAEAGCRVHNHYAISETGPVGIACCDAASVDEVHLIDAKVAAICRTGLPLVNAPAGVAPIFLTTLLTSTPKLLINVETGDYAQWSERDCACPFGELGFRTRLRSIRSYEKLSSGGTHFTPQALLSILEEILPARFGGDPTDYQLVEDEIGGLPAVWLRIHPRLGALNEQAVTSTVIEALSSSSEAARMMASLWKQGGVLRVERQPPLATATGKILALHQARRSQPRLDP